MKFIKAISATLLILIVYIVVQFATGYFAPELNILGTINSKDLLFFAHAFNLIIVFIALYFFRAEYYSIDESKYSIRILLMLPILSALLYILKDPIYRFENIFELSLLPEKVSRRIIKDSILMLINSLLLAPIVEELVFRRLLFRVICSISRSWKLWLCLSTISFGLLHADTKESFISALILGVVLGIVYVKQGVYASIIVHFFYNVFAQLFYFNKEVYLSVLKELNFGVSYFAIILFCLVTIIYILRKLPWNSRVLLKKAVP